MKLEENIVHFFKRQSFTVVSTIDKKGRVHNSCKGIVEMDNEEIYLLDLYKRRTFKNLKENPNISLTAVNEHKFKGYCLKGKAEIVKRENLEKEHLEAWDEKINSRVSKRLIKNIHGERGHDEHPEFSLPKPEYMIKMKVEEVVDLTPVHLKE